MIRVRFAPSPTGYLHIGAARTALFNWLYARKNDGRFILRIEDTDVERSSEMMSRDILEGLRWLGIDWDEGPFFQSERLDLYRKKAAELLDRGLAYRCYCSAEELQRRKSKDRNQGGDYRMYDRLCRSLSDDERKKREDENGPFAIRFAVPDEEIRYTDLIHGDISVPGGVLEDFVLLRRDGLPTYHLSVVVDDLDMEISHVIRGDDHISNTPKHVLLFRAFGEFMPKFAHLALIMGSDKKKLSKRHGVTSVLQFKKDGYFSEAVVNFLAQMSWSPGEGKEVYSLEKLKELFSIKKLSKGSPVYDPEKLKWLNGRLITEKSAEELYSPVLHLLQKEGLAMDQPDEVSRTRMKNIIDLVKVRNRTLDDFLPRMRPFLTDDFPVDKEGVEKHLRIEDLDAFLSRLASDFENLPVFGPHDVENALRNRAEKEGIKPAVLIHALRVLCLGMTVSPDIFEVLILLGKDRTVRRMGRISDVLASF
ncbi:MAG: glutamate--tRNA ligase [Candidatus Aminicenantes bacterium]|nr:glutamate--tRNA ligase [Candidatus Aminicenantes bacterium]